MTTDFRALCAELLDEFVYHTDWSDAEELKERARAALADEPAVPEGREPASVTGQPSDDELLRLYGVATPCHTVHEWERELNFARAVLARWGNPAPQPPAEGEVAELVADLQECADSCTYANKPYWAAPMRRAADLLQHLSPPQPVPVSERLPGPEDCDAQGRCWIHMPDIGTAPSWRLVDPREIVPYHTHWLPAHALPVPGQEVEG